MQEQVHASNYSRFGTTSSLIIYLRNTFSRCNQKQFHPSSSMEGELLQDNMIWNYPGTCVCVTSLISYSGLSKKSSRVTVGSSFVWNYNSMHFIFLYIFVFIANTQNQIIEIGVQLGSFCINRIDCVSENMNVTVFVNLILFELGEIFVQYCLFLLMSQSIIGYTSSAQSIRLQLTIVKMVRGQKYF